MNYFLILFLLTCEGLSLQAQSKPLVTSRMDSAKLPQRPAPSYPTDTMVKIKQRNMSAGLRSTLMNISYIGWEEGDLYMDERTNDYALFLPDKYWRWKEKQDTQRSGKENIRPGKWHFFSNEGRPVFY